MEEEVLYNGITSFWPDERRGRHSTETPEEKSERLKRDRERRRIRLSLETPEQKHSRLQRDRERRQKRLANESLEKKEKRLNDDRIRRRNRLQAESNEEKELRLARQRSHRRERLAIETTEQRESRLLRDRDRRRRRLALETEEQRQKRLEDDKKRRQNRKSFSMFKESANMSDVHSVSSTSDLSIQQDNNDTDITQDSPAVKRQIMSLGRMDKVTTNSDQQKNSLSKKRRQIDGDTLNTYLAAILQRIHKTSTSQDQLENPSERLVSHLSSPIGASPNGIQENKENLVNTFQSPFSVETSTNCSILNDSLFERENILDQLFADSFDENLLASSCVSPTKDLTNFSELSNQKSSCELLASSCINIKSLSHQAVSSTTTLSPTQRTSISSHTHSSSTVSCPITHSSPHTHSATHILKPCDQKELTKQTTSGSWEENDEDDDEDTMFWTQVANFMDESTAVETDPFLTSLDHTTIDQIFQVDDDDDDIDNVNIGSKNIISSPKRACSQEDIERKRQLAKRKLHQKLRTF